MHTAAMLYQVLWRRKPASDARCHKIKRIPAYFIACQSPDALGVEALSCRPIPLTLRPSWNSGYHCMAQSAMELSSFLKVLRFRCYFLLLSGADVGEVFRSIFFQCRENFRFQKNSEGEFSIVNTSGNIKSGATFSRNDVLQIYGFICFFNVLSVNIDRKNCQLDRGLWFCLCLSSV